MPAKKVDYDADNVAWVGITDKDLQRWQLAYPDVDLQGELRCAANWADANPARCGKMRNWKRFLVNWLKNSGKLYHVNRCVKRETQGNTGTARQDAAQTRRNTKTDKEYPEPERPVPRI